MLNRIVALLGAIWLSLRYMLRLKINRREIRRYLSKSSNLAVCYSGFSMPGALGQAFRAGKSAFLSCAYDVVTDWREHDSQMLNNLREILLAQTSPENLNLALDLYTKDINGLLEEDGLERGSIALKFIINMIGSGDFFADKIDIDYAGRLWQLVDDLLDYEADLESGDLNCLDSPNRFIYLKRAELLIVEPFANAFLHDTVLARVTQQAVKKARLLSNTQMPYRPRLPLITKNYHAESLFAVKAYAARFLLTHFSCCIHPILH